MKTTSLAGIVALLIGIFIGVFVTPYLPASFGNYKKGYQAGFDAAKMLVASSSVGAMFTTPADIRTLSGVVIAVNGSSITLRISSTDPFADPALADRIITVDANTKIVALTQSNQKVFQAEMDAFVKASQTGASTTPPTPFTQSVSDLASIKTGEAITATAVTNIKTSRQFTASEIQIQPKAVSSVATSSAAKK